MMQTLENLTAILPLEIENIEPRRLLLTTGSGRDAHRWLMEYEDAHYDLGRLHRLALGHRELASQQAPENAILVHRGRPLSAEERDAVNWACGSTPLDVLSLEQVASYFLANSIEAAVPVGR